MNCGFVKCEPLALTELCKLYEAVTEAMRVDGRKAWEWEQYPSTEIIMQDIEAVRLFALYEDERMIAAFALCAEIDEQHRVLPWQYGIKPVTLHRLAIAPDKYCEAAISDALDVAREISLKLGFDSLRLDACRSDKNMLKVCRRAMTRIAGETAFEDAENASVCFESPLTAECPMLPIKMSPAYRFGEMTPWGGDGLRTLYNKDIPDPRTGEALEISAIKDLESISAAGEKLGEILDRDPMRLTGKAQAEEFPLLLKLLCAKQPLSVQVHPDDAYSRENEGKLGKSEAWVILAADEGAGILYGLNKGVTIELLRTALETGEDIEPMISRVEAHPGDVFYMPSGMVHAIGGGITLYEIQQSSDVTYRLWDYNRTNAKGEKRPLHLKQALDVIVPALEGQRARLPEEGGNCAETLLDVPAFKLDCVCVNGEYELAPHTSGFRIITALKGLLLSWQNDALELEAGQSALLPAACPPITLMGVGRALIARA